MVLLKCFISSFSVFLSSYFISKYFWDASHVSPYFCIFVLFFISLFTNLLWKNTFNNLTHIELELNTVASRLQLNSGGEISFIIEMIYLSVDFVYILYIYYIPS